MLNFIQDNQFFIGFIFFVFMIAIVRINAAWAETRKIMKCGYPPPEPPPSPEPRCGTCGKPYDE